MLGQHGAVLPPEQQVRRRCGGPVDRFSSPHGHGETASPGYPAMVVSALTGHRDAELLQILPSVTTADRVALVGMHDWTDPRLPAIADDWGLTVFGRTNCDPPGRHWSTGSVVPAPRR